MNVVAFAIPLKFTTDVLTKPEPFTVSVKAAPPAAALVGAIDDAVGAGLLIVKVWALELPPPGFDTVTFAVPPVPISAAGMVAMI